MRYRFVARDGTEIIFREPRLSDARQFADFINRFLDEPMSGMLVNHKISLKEEKEWVKGVLRDIRNRTEVMLTAELDGVVKGNCSISRRKWKEAHRAVFGIALSEDVRGKGIGEELMRRTIELAKKRMRGLEIIELCTLEYNTRALALYKKLGFVKTGKRPLAVKEGNDYYAEYFMFLPLKKMER